MKFDVRLMRSPEGDGGAALPPTMEDVIKGGDGTTKIEELPDPEKKPQKPDPEKQPSKPEEGAEKKPEEGAAGEGEGEQEGGEQQEQDGAEEHVAFYQIVENTTGLQLEVKYPEGVSPLSPEGVAIREKTIWERSAQQLEHNLRTNLPRGYAYLRHLEAGGKDEDFFDNGRHSYTLPTVEDVRASADTQAAVYRQDLVSKGLDAESIEALLQKAIKDNKLLEKAEAAHATISSAQRKALEDVERRAKEVETQRENAVKDVVEQVRETLTTNFSLVIPQVEQTNFEKYVLDQLEYDEQTRKFYIVQGLDAKQIKTQLEGLFFQYKKGDLKSLVEKKAATKAAQSLRLKMDSTKSAGAKQAGDTSDTQRTVTLGEINV